MKQRERETERKYVPVCDIAVGKFNCKMVCNIMEREAQTKPRKFLANEIEKESNDTFDMRKGECEEMMRVRQRKTIR